MSRFGYAGEWVDETTGYSFLRARWLDVKTGSFLSEDPLVQMTQNAFGYTEGDPLTQIDPLGLFSSSDLVTTGPIVVTEKNIDSIKNVLSWTRSNSGYISAGLGVSSIIAASTVVGAPVAVVLSAGSIVFSLISIEYEIANCIGYTKDKKCDPISLGLASAGLVTGGLAPAVGKLGYFYKNSAINIENASIVTGLIGSAFSASSGIVGKLKESYEWSNCT